MGFLCSSSNFGAAIKFQIVGEISQRERAQNPEPSLKASEREGAWQRPWPRPRSIREKAREGAWQYLPQPLPEASEREREWGSDCPSP